MPRDDDIQQDNVHEAGDWLDPFPQLRWTVNRTAHAVVGATVRPEEDYPCASPHPCVDPDGRTFRPGRMVTITLHPARGRDLINEPDTVNRELCRHHYGAVTVNKRGRMAPVICSLPNNLNVGGYTLDDYYAFVGFYTVGDTAERSDDDLLSLCGAGRMCGVVELQLPETIEGVFDSSPLYCGGDPF